MGIKFRCPACDKKLHVKSFLAGKRGVCPKCGAKVRIPFEGDPVAPAASVQDAGAAQPAARGREMPVGPQEATPPGVRRRGTSRSGRSLPADAGIGSGSGSRRDPLSQAPDAVWYVRPPSGGQFGPADAVIMRRWLQEGRIGADALVWREGWPDWHVAGSVFPSLEENDLPASAADDLVPEQAANHALVVPNERPAMSRQPKRVRSILPSRNVAIVVALSTVCVALLVALFMVLRARN